jgi:hypothetical protein
MQAPSTEQIAAYEHEVREAERRGIQDKKRTFVHDFLSLADRVTDSSSGQGGEGTQARGFQSWMMSGRSEAINTENVETGGDSVPMGIQLVGHRSEVNRTRWRKKVVASKVTAAEVQVGPITPDPFRNLAEPTTILQVFSQPPTILQAVEGQLTPVQPDTSAWSEVTAMLESLKAQEEQLTSRFK